MIFSFSSPLFLFSFLRFSLLFSSPLSSLVLSLFLHVSFSFSFFFFSFLFSCLLLLFSFSFSFLSLSSFSVCWWCVCVVVCVVVCVLCVCGVVWCVAVWSGTLKTPCVDSKTPPCVDSKRPRVCRQHAHMLFSMCAWCRHTRGRF